MTKEQWRKELKKYRTPRRTVKEVLQGLDDHLHGEGACNSGKTHMVAVAGSPTGLGKKSMTCSRGTNGCSKDHNDAQAMEFTIMGLERLKEQIK